LLTASAKVTKWRDIVIGKREGLTDGVEKVRRDRSARNNRIVTADATNRYCCFGADLESMLLGETGQILFQQHRPEADGRQAFRKVRKGRATTEFVGPISSRFLRLDSCCPRSSLRYLAAANYYSKRGDIWLMAILRKLTDVQKTPRRPVRHVFEHEALIAVGGDRPLRLPRIDRAFQQWESVCMPRP